MAKNGKKDTDNSLSKTELKRLMKQFGVTMQSIADNSGFSKVDVSRIMNEEMEAKIMVTARRLVKQNWEKSEHLKEMLA
jgi:histone H3/H4